jgi:hypothetical protein
VITYSLSGGMGYFGRSVLWPWRLTSQDLYPMMD